MPSSIPYHPALVLGNIVDLDILAQVKAIGDEQARADAAEQRLNDQIALKRSLDMTLLELQDATGPAPSASITEFQAFAEESATKAISSAIVEANAGIAAAAKEYAKTKVEVLKNVAKLQSGEQLTDNARANGRAKEKDANKVHGVVGYGNESPIDYSRTSIKKMPLAADSLKLNAQYFSYEKNNQSSRSMAAAIKSFVSASFSTSGFFGLGAVKASTQAASQVSQQVSHQYENHSTKGTLVLTIQCTHKDAALLSPMVIDPDKAVRSWNRMFPKDRLDISDPEALLKIAETGGGKESKDEVDQNSYEVISGATHGSSFIAMIHILNTSETRSDQNMLSVAAQLQSQASVAWGLANVSGGFGVDSSYSTAMKSLLSTQSIQTHCNIVTVGSIPSIRANDVKLAVKEFADFDPAASMSKLAELQNAGADAMSGMGGAMGSARTGSDMVNLEAAKVKSVVSAVREGDVTTNKILDINTVMNAMDDYVTKALEGNLGVPINYYLHTVSRDEVAHMWLNKYYPFLLTAKSKLMKVETERETGEKTEEKVEEKQPA